MENLDRIKELAQSLNRSTHDWLDANIAATQQYSTQADRDALAAMALQKEHEARELHYLLKNF